MSHSENLNMFTTVVSRAFAVAASPMVWNLLSVNTRSTDSISSFKHRLKSELHCEPKQTQQNVFVISSTKPNQF